MSPRPGITMGKTARHTIVENAAAFAACRLVQVM
jgi:hypothetical protein